MNKHERIPILRSENVTLYGRVIDTSGKMGLYEVISEKFGSSRIPYQEFSEAEKRYDELAARQKKK